MSHESMSVRRKEVEYLDAAIRLCKNVKDTGALSEVLYSLFTMFPTDSYEYSLYHDMHVSLATQQDKRGVIRDILSRLVSRKRYLTDKNLHLF